MRIALALTALLLITTGLHAQDQAAPASTAPEAADARAVEEVKQALPIPKRDGPATILSKQQLSALKQKINQHDWAARAWRPILANAGEAIAQPQEVPPRGGGWYHAYACPECDGHLHKEKYLGDWQWLHICRKCKTEFGPDHPKAFRDFDGYSIMEVHHRLAEDMRDLGLVYQLTGEAKYADRAREILLTYSDLYLTYPRHNHWGLPWPNAGHVASHMLSEALWCVPAAIGADLIWDTLSADEKQRVADKLFLPLVNNILIPQDTGYHNRQVWKNSAIALVGYLLGDGHLVWMALEHPSWGNRAVVKASVTDLGAWREGSWSYHFYSLSAIWFGLEAARNNGLNLYTGEQAIDQLDDMYRAPFRLASPTGVLPSFNDSGRHSLRGHSSNCELAYARFGDPIFASLIDRDKRHGEIALFYGAQELPEVEAIDHQPAIYRDSGFGILTMGDGPDATWLCMKFGDHGGGHGHYDKASFVLYAKGRPVAVDPGMALYTTDVHRRWYKTSVAHNTLVVDGRSQSATRGEAGEIVTTDDGVQLLTIDAGNIYPGVRLRRTAAIADADTLVFIDRIEAEESHLYDLALHIEGKWQDRDQARPFEFPDAPGYAYLEDVHLTHHKEPTTLTIARPGNHPPVAITLSAHEPIDAITATGVGHGQKRNLASLLQRRRAEDTTFVWAVSLDGQPVTLDTAGLPEFVTVKRSGQQAVKVPFNAGWRAE